MKHFTTIENKTTWNTNDLNKIFSLCSKKFGYVPKKIIIYYSKPDRAGRVRIGGRGTIGHGWIRIGLPHTDEFFDKKKNKWARKKILILEGHTIERLAQVYIHEMSHNLRLRHKEMISSRKININYVKNLKVYRSTKKSTPYYGNRKKLSPFVYKGFKAKIYKYPGVVKRGRYRNGKHVKLPNGARYSYLIYDKNKTRVYKEDKIIVENINEIKKKIKERVNKHIEKLKTYTFIKYKRGYYWEKKL